MPALAYPDPPLADDVVALRAWRDDDLEQRFAAFDNPECLAHSWSLLEPHTVAHQEASMRGEEGRRLAGKDVHLAVTDAAEPETLFGGCSVYGLDLYRSSASVGYWLVPAARGRGVATRTVRLLAGWAFGHLGVERLELTCGTDNLASQRVAERCGFTHEGVLRSHMPFRGGRRDTMLFSLLPGEL
jgi:RimJ/RimL family protein N-acetyltransferase